MRIAIASDHGGYRLKAELLPLLRGKEGLVVEDLGTSSVESVDYPDYAHGLATAIVRGSYDRGILICGTGVGMSIAANRHPSGHPLRELLGHVHGEKLSRQHNDTNVLSLGERVLGRGLAWEIVTAWLDEPADPDERHARRRRKIEP